MADFLRGHCDYFSRVQEGRKIRLMIDQDLLEILVCPVCRKALAIKTDGQGLKCEECRRVYPIRDDIPIMLVDEAVIDPS